MISKKALKSIWLREQIKKTENKDRMLNNGSNWNGIERDRNYNLKKGQIGF